MSDFFNPAARELDLFSLAALVFLPAAAGLLILILPGKYRELLRWVATFAAAGTLCLALCTVVDYYRVLQRVSPVDHRTLYHPSTTLEERILRQQARTAAPVPGSFLSDDLVVLRPWVERFDVQFALGADGINLALVALTALVVLLAIVASWTVEKNLKGYLVLILLLETGVLGAFLSLDFVLFYVFYELMLLPMYFLVGVWGSGRRKYAAAKFVIYTLAGSVCLLAAIIALYGLDVRDFVDQNVADTRSREVLRDTPGISAEEQSKRATVHTFDPFAHARMGQAAMLILTGQEAKLGVRGGPPDPDKVQLLAPGVDVAKAVERLKASPVTTPAFQYAVFALLFLGFAVKVPVVPFHAWLPDAHVEAPTPVSMILAGVLLKLGGYGLIRFAFPICPWAAAELSWWVGLLGAVGILYGALAAMAQTDFKKLLAYSSVSHMGYVLLGLAAWGAGDRAQYWEWGVNGAVFQMVAHGVTSAGLFFAVGVVYDRAHHRDLDKLGGLTEPMPLFTGLSGVLFFASLGLPGLCGFVGEAMTLLAAWNFAPGLAVAAAFGTVLTAGYLLRGWQKAYLGVNPATAAFPDVGSREVAVLLPLAILCVVLGVVPSLTVFQWVDPAVSGWVRPLARLK